MAAWRGAGAVEQASLENWSGGNSTVGSNPTLSVIVLWIQMLTGSWGRFPLEFPAKIEPLPILIGKNQEARFPGPFVFVAIFIRSMVSTAGLVKPLFPGES